MPESTLIRALRQNLSILQELANRYEVATNERTEPGPVISSPEAAWSVVQEMQDLAQEQMRVLVLDSRNQLLGSQVVYHGNINTCIVRQAEIFRLAIILNASNLILVHNHPSGDPTPSKEDVTVTGQVLSAGRLLGIHLLDHIIVGKAKMVSLRSTSDNLNWSERE